MENIRFPDIPEGSTEAQVAQMRRYLFEMVEQVNFALQELSSSTGGAAQAVQQLRTAQKQDSGARTPGATFASIKALIIKSADIIEAYSEEFNRKFSGQYVAQSVFGTYSERTEQAIRENSSGINRIFTNIQELAGTVTGLNDRLSEVNAYIKTGKLYDDEIGIPVYGVEIGQRNTVDGAVTFQKCVRLTSGKLAFFDANDNEVAFISDRQLHITSADVQELTCSTATVTRLRLGDYMLSYGADGHLTLS